MTPEPPGQLVHFLNQGTEISAPDGSCLFHAGDAARGFLIVTAGTVRVEQSSPGGRTVTLYRVHAGDSCVMTTTCILSDRPYTGAGYAEGAVTATAIPVQRFRQLLATQPAFQDVVFRGFAQRLTELTEVIDALLGHRTDLRIARWLGAQEASTLAVTHEDIAQELGTAREVVSRTLKSFEQRGWVALARGSVRIMARDALAQHGQSETV